MSSEFEVTVFTDDSVDYACLSNKFVSDIKIDGQTFLSVEHYMLYRQAIAFGDEEAAAEILACKRAKSLDKVEIRKNASEADDMWSVERNIALYKALSEKFKLGDGHFSYLWKASKKIIYLSEDTYMGAIAPLDENKNFSLENLRGENMLGKTLRYIRKQRLKEIDEQLLWHQQKNKNE